MSGLPRGVEKLGEGRYRGRYRGPDGRKHSTKTYSRPEHAAWARAQAVGRIATGMWLDPARDCTLDEWFTLWMPKRQRVRGYVVDKDWTRYRLHIKPWLGHLPLSKITPFVITTWHHDLANAGRSAAMIDKAHTLLKTALGPKGAMGDERLHRNPCQISQPDTPERPKWRQVTPAEFETLLAQFEHADHQDYVLTASLTGLRASELVRLNRENYNSLRGELLVARGMITHKGHLIEGPTKSRQERTVPCVAQVKDTLDALLVRRGNIDPGAPLFVSLQGQRIRHEHFMHRYYRPAALRAGLAHLTPEGHYNGVRFHDLRHSCASWLLEGGATMPQAMEILGHASITTTQLYVHNAPDVLRSSMEKALGKLSAPAAVPGGVIPSPPHFGHRYSSGSSSPSKRGTHT